MTIATPEPTVDRDRYGRPLIKPANGDGKPVSYRRCTTFIDVLDDKFRLDQWKQRAVASGLARRPDLLLSVQSHLDDKRALDRDCDAAREAAAASAAATTGTALHALTELIDRGQELPVGLSAAVTASLDAYRAATAGLKHLHIERMTVNDKLKVAGTPDRVVKVGKGKGATTAIFDLKTGSSIEWGALKIAQQLALYSRSHLYDVKTGERSDHGAQFQRGIVCHLPAVTDPAEARCEMVWIDLEAGWNAVLVARDVWEKRSVKFSDLTEPFTSVTPDLTPVLEDSIREQITACTDADAVRALWRQEWDDDLVKFAAAHVATLAAAS